MTRVTAIFFPGTLETGFATVSTPRPTRPLYPNTGGSLSNVSVSVPPQIRSVWRLMRIL